MPSMANSWLRSSLYTVKIAAQGYLFEGYCCKRIPEDMTYKKGKGKTLSKSEVSSECSVFSLVRRECLYLEY